MIPQFEEIRIQALKELSSGVVMRAKELRIPLAKHFGLTEEEMNAWYPSGNGEIFLDRISWALSYLFIAGLVEKPQRGDYKISEKGLSMLSSCTTILSKQPREFERLVVKLLQAMGYGGEIKNSGIVTKLSNDGGIDGIIKEDILGFNHISIQAKRYALDNNVGRNEVQSFVGAVAGTPSKKGVFITTSDYTKGAMEYVESLNGSPTIILINGQQLTEYIYDYGLGLQTEKVLKIMKMDMDYWDAMDNA